MVSFPVCCRTFVNVIHLEPTLPLQLSNAAPHAGDLEHALDDAWNDLNPDSDNLLENIDSLPEIFGPGLSQLPYRTLEDEAAKLYVPQTKIPVQLTIVKLGGNSQSNCFICGEEFRISDMRNHVGTHILKARREVEDETILNGVEVSIYAVF